MKRAFRSGILAFTAMSFLLQVSLPAEAQTLRTRVEPSAIKKSAPQWPVVFGYGVTSDYADKREPRSYTHALSATVGYNVDENWSLGMELGLKAATEKGQISKGKEETYAEVLNPSAEFEVSYGGKLGASHTYGLAAHGEPLLDEPSRLEGYKGVVGASGSLILNFFGKRYSLMNAVDASSLINTFRYAADGSSNPDYFYSYKMKHSVRFLGNNKISFGFGAKVTKYLDGFTGYSYKNSVALSHSWNKLTASIAYENGGFTDEGKISMWYLDQYRRMITAGMSYAF